MKNYTLSFFQTAYQIGKIGISLHKITYIINYLYNIKILNSYTVINIKYHSFYKLDNSYEKLDENVYTKTFLKFTWPCYLVFYFQHLISHPDSEFFFKSLITTKFVLSPKSVSLVKFKQCSRLIYYIRT